MHSVYIIFLIRTWEISIHLILLNLGGKGTCRNSRYIYIKQQGQMMELHSTSATSKNIQREVQEEEDRPSFTNHIKVLISFSALSTLSPISCFFLVLVRLSFLPFSNSLQFPSFQSNFPVPIWFIFELHQLTFLLINISN